MPQLPSELTSWVPWSQAEHNGSPAHPCTMTPPPLPPHDITRLLSHPFAVLHCC